MTTQAERSMENAVLVPVILAGGKGTRLWPLSREYYPKQILSFEGEHSLFQQTVERAQVVKNILSQSSIEVAAPLIIAHESLRFSLSEQLESLNVTPTGILLEPVGRNTAPAIGLAAAFLEEHEAFENKDVLLWVMPADHAMPANESLASRIDLAATKALQNNIVTLGVEAKSPHTGYGYIQMGEELTSQHSPKWQSESLTAHQVSTFVEKPDIERAKSMLDQGNYVWNAGIFICRADDYLQALSDHNRPMYKSVKATVETAEKDLSFVRFDEATFSKCPDDSIDYAIMEPLTQGGPSKIKAVVVPLNSDWSDLGSWSAVREAMPQDDAGNVTRGNVLLEGAKNTLVHSPERLTVVVGAENLIVIDTKDALLVMDQANAESIKKVVTHLKEHAPEYVHFHQRVYRPWGDYETIDLAERYQVKRITVKVGAVLSLQKHHHRAEHWIVVKGTAEVTRDQDVFNVTENESTYIPLGAVHRLRNVGHIPLELIEVQSGSYLGEDDIVRLEDVYGRNEKSDTISSDNTTKTSA